MYSRLFVSIVYRSGDGALTFALGATGVQPATLVTLHSAEYGTSYSAR